MCRLGSKTLFLSIISLLLTGCLGGIQVRTNPDTGDPVAEFPIMCKGDTWVEHGWSSKVGTDTYTATVDNVNEDGSFERIWASEKGKTKERAFVNNKHELVREVNLINNEENNISSPPAKRLNFPLFVGKRWVDNYSGTSISGKTYMYTNMYTVTGYQKIKVKAGEFDVFRIWKAHSNQNSVNNSSSKEIYYYAPDAKFIVLSNPSWREGYELLEYTKGNCE